MARTVRLGWETRIDQLTLAGTLAIAGIGLVVGGAWLGGVFGVVLIVLGVRLVSVIGDDLEHAGQAALLRGIAERR